MRTDNFFRMNDWEITRFLKVVFAIQVTVCSFVGLGQLGVSVPVLSPIVGFLFLTFIPGYILLRIFRMHRLGNVESVLFAAGLSLFTLMLTGLITNTFLQMMGIPDPMSTINLTIAISLVVFSLSVIAYYRDESYADTGGRLDLDELFSPPCLAICSVPFLVVIGTFLVNRYSNNWLLMLMIAVIAMLPVAIIFGKSFPARLYPLAVFSAAVSLLLHNALMSSYISGWDVNQEYYWSRLVLDNSAWVLSDLSSVNGMLSIVMLAPIYTRICDLDLTWTLKLVYPLIFALVPLTIFRIVQRQTNDRIAFIASFFFVSLFTFYTEMLYLCRQQIAELFLALIVLLFVSEDMKATRRSLLLIILGFSMIVSHYGTSYIYLAVFSAAWLMLVLIGNPVTGKILERIDQAFSKGKSTFVFTYDRKITLAFLFIYIALLFTWYIYISSFTFLSVIDIGDRISSSITTDFLDRGSTEGLSLVASKNTVTPLHTLSKYIHLFTQFLIFVGLIATMLYPKKMRLSWEYIAFSIINLGMCLASLTVPFFASSLNTSRIYQISLILLAPFAVIGGILIVRAFIAIVRAITRKMPEYADNRFPYKVLAVLFSIYLLFNVSFIYEIFGDDPNSISLSQESMKKIGTNKTIAAFYQRYYVDNEVYSAAWLGDHRDKKAWVYADGPETHSLLLSYGMMYEQSKRSTGTLVFYKPEKDSYIMYNYFNSKHGLIDMVTVQFPLTLIAPALRNSSLIYDNNGSKVFMT